MNRGEEVLLRADGLEMHFPILKGLLNRRIGWVKAVDGISFTLERGNTLGLIGESGCGKTTVGKCVLRILEPTGGAVVYQDRDIAHLPDPLPASVRRDIQYIFQDPYGSLNPRHSLKTILSDALKNQEKRLTGGELRDGVDKLLLDVELDPYLCDRYPHELSGGQRQRVAIARSLACDPKIIVCDEPVSALDVSIQAQIVNLLLDLQSRRKVAYLFIAHDLALVKRLADAVAVLYLGKIVESASVDALYENPLHPYTKALLSAIPTTDYDRERTGNRVLLEGEAPSPVHIPSGCSFHPRCVYATGECSQISPQLRDTGDSHLVACHRAAAG